MTIFVWVSFWAVPLIYLSVLSPIRQYYLIYFVAKCFPSFQWELSRLASVSFWHTSNILCSLIKFILLIERRQSKKIIDCLTPFIWHYEKGIIEIVNRSASYDKTRQRIKKQRHRFADKGSYSQSYDFFSVVMYRCENWTIKKAEHWRIDAIELWCWRRLLRVPWTARRSNQSILKKSTLNIHWKDWGWSWSSNTLATWCEEPTHWKRLKADPLEKILRLGKTEGKRGMGAAVDETVR